MDAIIYYILLPFIYAVSVLPFRLLYLFSNFLFFIIYYVVGYRKKVVVQNLSNAFSHKTEVEIRELTEKFFRYLCDVMLETFKVLTISERKLRKHIISEIDPALSQAYESGKSVLLVMGHYGNWEMVVPFMGAELSHLVDGVYRPLANPYFDKLIYRIRSRFGLRLCPMKGVMRYLLSHKHETTALLLISDQTPHPNQAHWMKFLNQDTGVFTGTAKIARKFDRPIFYVSVQRHKRGFYHVKYEPLILNPRELSEEEISFRHMKRLEEDIRRNPEFWLWSHRRWKHTLPEGKRLYEELKKNK